MNERMYIHSFNTYHVECFPYQALLKVVEIQKSSRQPKFPVLMEPDILAGEGAADE